MLQPASALACTGLEDGDGLFGRKAQEDRQTCCPVPGTPLARVMFASSTLAVGTIPSAPSRFTAPQHDAQVLGRQDFGELSRAAGNAPAGRS